MRAHTKFHAALARVCVRVCALDVIIAIIRLCVAATAAAAPLLAGGGKEIAPRVPNIY